MQQADQLGDAEEALLRATEEELDAIAAATRRPRRALHGGGAIGLRVGRVLGRFKMPRHFEITITDTAFSYARKTDAITREARLDSIYVIRTSVPEALFEAGAAVRAYKRLAAVERAFRCLKTVDLQVRPDPPPADRPGPRARVPVHARLPCRVAHAARLGAVAVRRG